MEKILDIIDSIAHEKGLKPEDVQEALKTAFVKTAQRVINPNLNFEAEIDHDTKTLKVFQSIEVAKDGDDRLEDEETRESFISLTEAKEIDDDAELGDELQTEHNIEDYGRSGAASLHREIEFHIQRLLENDIFNKYKNKIGTLVSGRVTRVDGNQNTYIEIDEVRAMLPMKSRIKGEKFKVADVLSAVVRRVNVDKEHGIQIEISRTTPKFLEELLRLEVPEIADGAVEIIACARIPGERAKVALMSNHPQVDPVGATVGVKGSRINAVSAELNGENIDAIEHNGVDEIFLSRAMSPAIITHVETDKSDEDHKKAKITLPSDQKSKAIGKSGINIRLASMLCGYEIELIESDENIPTSVQDEKKDDISSLEALFN